MTTTPLPRPPEGTYSMYKEKRYKLERAERHPPLPLHPQRETYSMYKKESRKIRTSQAEPGRPRPNHRRKPPLRESERRNRGERAGAQNQAVSPEHSERPVDPRAKAMPNLGMNFKVQSHKTYFYQ